MIPFIWLSWNGTIIQTEPLLPEIEVKDQGVGSLKDMNLKQGNMKDPCGEGSFILIVSMLTSILWDWTIILQDVTVGWRWVEGICNHYYSCNCVGIYNDIKHNKIIGRLFNILSTYTIH